MEQHISQEEVRRIIISDMVKKRNSIVPLALLWLSYKSLKWIRSAFIDDSKVKQRYTLLTNISALAHEAYLVAPRTYVLEAKNLCEVIKVFRIREFSQY